MRVLFLSEYFNYPDTVAARRSHSFVRYLLESGIDVAISAPYVHEHDHISAWGETRIPLKTKQREVYASLSKKTSSQIHPSLRRWVPAGMIDRSVASWLRAAHSNRELNEYASKCDIVLPSYGPAGPLWAGLSLAYRKKKRFIVDIRDAPESRNPPAFFSRYVLHVLENIVFQRAELIVTVGDTLATYFSSRHFGKKTMVIYNGWTEDDMTICQQKFAYCRYIYYAGTIYQHQISALKIVFSSLLMIPDLSFKIRLIGENDREIRKIADEFGLTERVEILPKVGKERVLEEQRNAVALIVLENMDPREAWASGTVTGKLFGALASGTSVIAVCSERMEISSILRKFVKSHSINNTSQFIDCISHVNSFDKDPELDVLGDFHMKNQIKQLSSYIRNYDI